MSCRYAIFFTFDKDMLLHHLVSAWLGHDVYRHQMAYEQTLNDEILGLNKHAILTPKACIYGFHATLKAPFRLKPGISQNQLVKTFKSYAKTCRRFKCEPLVLTQLDNFIALQPEQPCQKLNNLAKNCVETFEVFRAELTAQELLKRKPDQLSENQKILLGKWGYPYVMDEYRFHMTLTDAIAQAEMPYYLSQLQHYLQPALGENLKINRLSLLCQRDSTSRFYVVESIALKK